MVEYSAFNRLVPGSSPGQPKKNILILIVFNIIKKTISQKGPKKYKNLG